MMIVKYISFVIVYLLNLHYLSYTKCMFHINRSNSKKSHRGIIIVFNAVFILTWIEITFLIIMHD